MGVNISNRNANKYYKDGTKKPANYQYSFEVASVNGKRQRVSKAGFTTKKEAEIEGNKAFQLYHSVGELPVKCTMSVADYLEKWLDEAIAKGTYSNNTYNDYVLKVKNYFIPAFGNYKMDDFQHATETVQTCINDLKKRLSESTVRNSLFTLKSAMDYAIRMKYIKNNPCVGVTVGRMPVNIEAKEHREYVLTPSDYQDILKRFPKGSLFYLSIAIPYHAGLRLGETFGLTYDDIYDGVLHLKRQMQKEGKQWFMRNPKYDSIRDIILDESILQDIEDAKAHQESMMKEYGKFYIKTYLTDDNVIIQSASNIKGLKQIYPIMVRDNGELLTTESWKYPARVIHNELNNTNFHHHCIRHTHGTILAENGVNPKTVMERLGHKDVATTLNTYTFNTESMQQYAVDQFSNYCRQQGIQ